MADSKSIVCDNLPAFTTKEQLEEIFSAIGPIKTCTISKKDSRATGYITFASEQDVEEALNKPLKLGKIPLRPRTVSEAKNIVPKKKLFKIKLNKEHRQKLKSQKGKIIIKNMSYKVTPEQLKKVFREFGTIRTVNLPQKEGGLNRGFGFVLFEETKAAIKAINKYNGTELFGRAVTVDFAMSKDKYTALQKKTDPAPNNARSSAKPESQAAPSKSEEEEEDDDDDNEVADGGGDEEENEESKDDESDEEKDDGDEEEEEAEKEEDEEQEEEIESAKEKKKRWRDSDVTEGRTLFIRNLSFDVTQEMLKEEFSKFGPLKYSVLCYDKSTKFPKGTGFVKYHQKQDAEKCLDHLSDQPLFLDGRMLEAMLAKPRNEISADNKNTQKKPGKDNRNLALLREGNVDYTKNDGISKADKELRGKIAQQRKAAIDGSLYKFVSTTRLTIYNIPPQLDNAQLRAIFAKAAGPNAKITEAKIMYNKKKTGPDSKPVSRGFGFINFTTHEDALKALHSVNNNSSCRPFKPTKRPIVYFSIEDKLVHMAKEQHKEKQRKLAKQKQERPAEQVGEEKIYSVPVKRKLPHNNRDNRPFKKFKKSSGPKKRGGFKGKRKH